MQIKCLKNQGGQMTNTDKAFLLSHYKWIVTLARSYLTEHSREFSDEDVIKNKKIWEILLDLKTKEK